MPGTVNPKGGRLCEVVAVNSDPVYVTAEIVAGVTDEFPKRERESKSKAAKEPKAPKPGADPGSQDPHPDSSEDVAIRDGRRPVTVGGETFTHGDRVRMAKAEIEHIPDDDLSRAGHGGQDRYYHRVAKWAYSFGIDRETTESELADAYDARLRDAARRHPNRADEFEPGRAADGTDNGRERKFDEVYERGETPEFPFWSALRRPSPTGEPFQPRAWNDPARLANEFLAKNSIHFIKSTPYLYDGTRYVILSVDALNATIRRFVEGRASDQFDSDTKRWERETADERARIEAERKTVAERLTIGGQGKEYDEAKARKLDTQAARVEKSRPKTVPLVNMKLIAALRARRQLRDDQELDAWLAGDRPPVLAVANGLLDPVSRKMIPHSPDWFSAVALPVEFDPSAPPPAKWLAYVDRVTEGDTDRAAVLQEIVVACLEITRPAKWFAMLPGTGDNGKSLFLVVLRAILGQRNSAARWA